MKAELLRSKICLYGITMQETNPEQLLEKVRAAAAGGMTMPQIRQKQMPAEKLVALAAPVLEFCRQNGILCLINDHVEAARMLSADCVHVGQNDMCIPQARAILGSDAIIGTSAHSVEEAVQAQKDGADYIGCGAVFPTGTKTDATPLSMETLCSIRKAVTIPMVAIGGITAENAALLKGSGIDGIAVVSAIFGQENPEQAARTMKNLAQQIVQEGASL